MKASEFLCPELVSTDTDDDDLTAAGSEYESRMHTTTATPTFSASRSRVEAATTTALHDEVIPAAKRGISSAARSARAQNKWNGSNETRTDGYVFEKARGREFPW